MKVIIAEKPSVAKEIASVLNASESKDGYIQGNGYQITWAIGHLFTLPFPDAYDPKYKQWSFDFLPFIPQPFKLQASAKTLKQYKVIKSLVGKADEVINAGDAGREGELIQRWILQEANYTGPLKRLWISSLTTSAIQEGFNNLKNGHDYDRLFQAGEGRAQADWLVGINGTMALTLGAESDSPLSVGRVQTPTLAMICKRFIDNRDFKPTDYFVPQIELNSTSKFKANFISESQITDKSIADNIVSSLSDNITCTKSQSTERKEKQPLLFDLTSLQADANRKYGFTADNTLKTAQSLYEKHKVLSYPRTDSRYLSEDIYDTLPNTFSKIASINEYNEYVNQVDTNALPKVSINDKKVSDHHAIIPTGEKPKALNDTESKIFDLVIRRFIASFSDVCIKNITTLQFTENNHVFESKGTQIVKHGWRKVEDQIKDNDEEKEDNQNLPIVKENESLTIADKKILSKKTKPKPLFNEASLLRAMETAGKEVEDSEARELMKDSGIGTPATRSNIIENIITRNYISRKGKNVIPTEIGMNVYDLVKDKKIASPELTGKWEKDLNQIANGNGDFNTFINGIKKYTSEIVEDFKTIELKIKKESYGTCPKCKEGIIVESKKAYNCNKYKDGCNFGIWKSVSGKTLTKANLKEILSNGLTKEIKGFKSKAGKSFSAQLELQKDFKLSFKFTDKVAKESATIHGILVEKSQYGYKLTKGEESCYTPKWITAKDLKKYSEKQINELFQKQLNFQKAKA